MDPTDSRMAIGSIATAIARFTGVMITERMSTVVARARHGYRCAELTLQRRDFTPVPRLTSHLTLSVTRVCSNTAIMCR
jgi:hypothetical protein